MISIALMNQKGGTGKTTSVVNIAGELILREKRVLIIDMDTQGNATANLEITRTAPKTLTDAVTDPSVTLADAICQTAIEGLDIIRGGALLGPAFTAIQDMKLGRDTVLRRLMRKLPKGYDFVLFDCSPSLESVLNINVLVAVKYVLIPIRVDKNSIEGYATMLETIQSVREIANPGLRALGIFMTAVEIGASLDREMIEALPQMLPDLAFNTYIRKNIDVKKAPIALRPLCFYNARCAGSLDYAALTDEMLDRIAEMRRK
ncbi:MAG: ParA family protein [Butyricicoccus sp.]|nr:ParA family protein [Butyricicoccus pullicaecorum]MCI6720106.1 ParA family protein [Clostridiales bacterium]MDY5971515.1 ParA family protein [Butyricicoccus sp.]